MISPTSSLSSFSTSSSTSSWVEFIHECSLFICSSIYPYIHIGNMLLVDNTPYKNMFNGPYIVIFLDPFDDRHGKDQYFLGFIFPYLENLHLSGYDVPTFVEHNPFGRIKCIDKNNPRFFKMLFVKCSRTCQHAFCNSAKLKLKQKILY